MHTSHQDSLWHFIKRGSGRWLLAVIVLTLLSISLASNPNAWAASGPGETNSSLHEPGHIQAYKTASQSMVASGQVLTYTIHVHNAGLADTTAQIADPLPHNMNYISGSANLGGVYDAGSNTLMWNTFTVTRGSEVALSFAVTAATVTTPTLVMNTAAITVGLEALMRSARVVVIPESMAAADLSPSAKYAARKVVTPGDAVPYTIKLINAGLLDATADITDPLPLELNYVAGSASAGGVYDAGTRTLSWQDIQVPAFGRVSLTFVATATTNIVSPTSVVNTATIAAGQQTIRSTSQNRGRSSSGSATASVVGRLAQEGLGALDYARRHVDLHGQTHEQRRGRRVGQRHRSGSARVELRGGQRQQQRRL